MTDNLALVIPAAVATLALYVWIAASLHAVFRKAGEEGWQAWVPVLNLIVLLRLGGFSGWWVLLLLVPGLGVIALAVIVWIACHRVNTAFGVGVGMTVLAIFLFPVWSSILGWGSARWLGREQGVPGPVRTATAPHVPPRPTSIPPVPPAGWQAPPALAVPAPAIVTRVPSAASAGEDDDLHALGYLPRSAGGLVSSVPGSGPADAPPAPAAEYGARRAAPYTGALPTLIDPDPHQVPAGPRRAVPPDDDEYDDHLNETRDAAPASPTPAAASGRDPWAPPLDDEPPVRTPRYSPLPGDNGFSETSAEVSAVAGAPALGVPLAARSSVSAMRDEPELPEAEGAFDQTIIASRRRTPWMLAVPLGAPIAVTSDVLIVGRRPSSDPAFAHAQLVPVADETRTMSKTHARLELHGDAWTITDLDSTNGVILLRPDGTEVEVGPGSPEPLTESFLLGDAELRLAREPGVE